MLKTRIHRPQRLSQMRGFTMIEVLVTLVIIALTLLGTAGLQSYAMKMNQGGQLRTQAVVLALDLLERIEANNAAAQPARINALVIMVVLLRSFTWSPLYSLCPSAAQAVVPGPFHCSSICCHAANTTSAWKHCIILK